MKNHQKPTKKRNDLKFRNDLWVSTAGQTWYLVCVFTLSNDGLRLLYTVGVFAMIRDPIFPLVPNKTVIFFSIPIIRVSGVLKILVKIFGLYNLPQAFWH